MAQGSQYTTSLTATSSGGSVTFTDSVTSIAMRAHYVRIENTGTSGAVYVNLTTTTGATTNDWAVNAGSSMALVVSIPRDNGYFSGLSYVALASGVPPFRVIALG